MDRPLTRVAVLGSTGSIGCQTLDVIRAHPGRFQVTALSAWTNIRLLAQQVDEFQPRLVACADHESLAEMLAAAPQPASLTEIACDPEVDIVVAGVVGRQGLEPVLRALECGKTVALANKEAMVMGGPLLRAAAANGGGSIRPVDSEHSAIWQCLAGEDASAVRRLVLT
ncbi:MAG TPA: 1-deoxy-D-xylulose-5-phosphate reductoisomerase, partial [Dehalococcoidia bacterium]|nr:1-deoxy-D-xylulose-5-phosphate reductoisomerase [Dehalococcoidia bacterium]